MFPFGKLLFQKPETNYHIFTDYWDINYSIKHLAILMIIVDRVECDK